MKPSAVAGKTIGYLYGLLQNNGILVLGFSLNESVEDHLPFGFKDLGLIHWTVESDSGSNPADSNVCTNSGLKLFYQRSDNNLMVLVFYNLFQGRRCNPTEVQCNHRKCQREIVGCMEKH